MGLRFLTGQDFRWNPISLRKRTLGKEVDVKARLLSKAEPAYTEEAREKRVVGTVVLKAVFTGSGQVTDIRVVQGLPHGLTEQAIKVARKIKFIPATKDGKYVSMVINSNIILISIDD